MKFVLFICISLLASMLHAVTMPASNMDHTQVQVAAIEMDHAQAHCDKSTQDDNHIKKHCPGNSSQCCFGVTLQLNPLSTLMMLNRQKSYALFSPRLVRHIPDVLFKPPKVYPVLTG